MTTAAGRRQQQAGRHAAGSSRRADSSRRQSGSPDPLLLFFKQIKQTPPFAHPHPPAKHPSAKSAKAHRHIVWQPVHDLQLLKSDLVNFVDHIQRRDIHTAGHTGGMGHRTRGRGWGGCQCTVKHLDGWVPVCGHQESAYLPVSRRPHPPSPHIPPHSPNAPPRPLALPPPQTHTYTHT